MIFTSYCAQYGYSKSKELLQGALDTLQASNIDDLELKRFLPKSHWPMIRTFKAGLEREIKNICSHFSFSHLVENWRIELANYAENIITTPEQEVFR